jgi:tetratricopeptide (TPR) repeat protein
MKLLLRFLFSVAITLPNLLFAQEAFNGILIYHEIPSTYLEVLKYSTIQRNNIQYSTIAFSGGGTRSILNNGILLNISHPPPYPSEVVDQLRQLIHTYPDSSTEVTRLVRQISPAPTKPGLAAKASTTPRGKPDPAAVSFVTKDGHVYSNVHVSKANDSELSVTTGDGITHIDFEQLPPDIQKRFHYDSAKSASEKERKRADEEARAKQTKQSQPAIETVKQNELENQEAPSAQSTPSSPIVIQGHTQQEISNAEEQLRKLDEIVGRNPLDYKTRDQRGFCQLELVELLFGQGESTEHYNAALNDFSVAIQSYERDADAYAGRAAVLLGLTRGEEAYADIKRALTLNPNQAFAYKVLGDYFLIANNETEALNAYSKALALQPGFKAAETMVNALKRKNEKTTMDTAAWAAGKTPEGFDEQVQESRKQAYNNYPALTNTESRFAKFTATYKDQIALSQADFFHYSDWPMKLAKAAKDAYVKKLNLQATGLIAPLNSAIAEDERKLNDLNSYYTIGGVFTARQKQGFAGNIENLRQEIKQLKSQIDAINAQNREEQKSITQK